jgi:uncharacterized protein YbgA (DUF1722 family)
MQDSNPRTIERLTELVVGRLADGDVSGYLDALCAYGRWRQLTRTGVTLGKLIDFHSRNKYLLMAHDPIAAKQLGKVVGNAKHLGLHDACQTYGRIYLECVTRTATVGRHVNVLQHMAGYLRGVAGAAVRGRVQRAIADYQDGRVVLEEVAQLIYEQAILHDIVYLYQQTYFAPREVLGR